MNKPLRKRDRHVCCPSVSHAQDAKDCRTTFCSNILSKLVKYLTRLCCFYDIDIYHCFVYIGCIYVFIKHDLKIIPPPLLPPKNKKNKKLTENFFSPIDRKFQTKLFHRAPVSTTF